MIRAEETSKIIPKFTIENKAREQEDEDLACVQKWSHSDNYIAYAQYFPPEFARRIFFETKSSFIEVSECDDW